MIRRSDGTYCNDAIQSSAVSKLSVIGTSLRILGGCFNSLLSLLLVNDTYITVCRGMDFKKAYRKNVTETVVPPTKGHR